MPAQAHALTSLPSAFALSAPLTFTTTTLHFTVHVGADAGTTCDVIGDLRVPAGVDTGHPGPAIMITNGFGDSKDAVGLGGVANFAARFAEQRYVTLAYSGLGWGGSTCPISLDDPDIDGAAGSQLISFLGGEGGIATLNGALYAVPGLVVQDAVTHDGRHHDYDPRVGMIGLSYGGEIELAIASVDPRLDTVVPLATWNDLAYSMGPNNAEPFQGVTTATTGVFKAGWFGLLAAEGFVDPVQNQKAGLTTCGTLAAYLCQALAEQASQGYLGAATKADLEHVSVESYADRIKIPVLLGQGQQDSLFNLAEAQATYTQLAGRVPVRMVWFSPGHSNTTAVPGELDPGTAAPGSGTFTQTYLGVVFSQWFDHWLRDGGDDLGPTLRDFRDYDYVAPPAGASVAEQYAAATAAYGRSDYPTGAMQTLYGSAASALVTDSGAVQTGSQTVALDGAVPGTSVGEIITDVEPPSVDAPGTYASWTTPELTAPLDLVGNPQITVHMSAPAYAAAQGASPAGQAQLFGKIYDVAPSGSATLVRSLVTAARVADVTQPVTIRLPGVVHQFAVGHQLRVVLAASDASYKGTGLPSLATFVDDPTDPTTLVLPLAPDSAHITTITAAAPAATPAAGSLTAPTPASRGTRAASPTPRTSATRVAARSSSADSPTAQTLASTGLHPGIDLMAITLLAAGSGLQQAHRRRNRRGLAKHSSTADDRFS